MLSNEQIQAIKGALTSSSLITSSDEGYAKGIKRWNDANEKPAGAILFAESENDIASAIKLATEFQLDIAVRGGGHSHWDASSTDGGLVIDLSKMNKVTVDPKSKTAAVQGGALWRDVDEALGKHALAAVGGTVNHTGVGGLTLGGGYGFLSGQHGLTIDNLLSARLVLADGSIVTASESSNPELFWAIRGAGHNFGVAVEFVYQAHDKTNDVFAGMILFSADKASAIVDFLRGWKATQGPNENIFVVLTVPPHIGQVAIAMVPFYDGPEDEAKRRFSGLLDIGPIVNMTSMRPYSTVNAIIAETEPDGRRKMQKGGVWSPPFTMDTLTPIIDEFAAMHKAYPEFAGSIVLLHHDYSEKIASVSNEAMAFANRGRYGLMMVQIASDNPELESVKHEYAQKIMNLMHGLSDGRIDNEPGAKIYPNYATGNENPRDVYGGNYERLAALKAKYDPNNIFNKYFPITPSSS